MRGTHVTETIPELEVGDHGETLVAMNVRCEIDPKSDIIGAMPETCQFTVVETGDNHRALISSGDVTGWIYTKTDLDQALTKKVKSGTGTLPYYESKVQLQMRYDLKFTSAVMMTLPEGSQFQLIEEGAYNRVKIFVVDDADEVHIGWVTSKTELDQPLITSLDQRAARMSKNLDTYIAKQLSQANFRKGDLEDNRNMTKVKSTGSNPGSSRAANVAALKEQKAPPKLSKLACCCGS